MDWKDPKPAPEPLALVQDFVNTRDYYHEVDQFGTAEEAAAMLRGRGLLEDNELLGESERERLVAFREGLRGLLLAQNNVSYSGYESDSSARALDEIVGSVSLRVNFWPDDRPALEPGAGGSPVDRLLARLLAVIATAESEGKWIRMKACRNEGCMWVFYDASKNRAGRWCDMNICGVRHKMRTYRERKAHSS